MSSLADILVIDAYAPVILKKLSEHFTLHHYKDLASLAPIAPYLKAIATTGAAGVPSGIMEALPHLEIIAVNGVGTDQIDLEQAKERQIPVSVTSNMTTNDVADLAIMLLMTLRRNFRYNEEYMQAGRWASEGYPPLSRSLEEKRMGIVGFGAIGQAIARRAQASEMEVTYYSRHKRPESSCPFEPDLLKLAEWADVLTLAVPGGAATQGLVNEDVLKALGPHGVLINIARGSVVDEDALIKALQKGTIAGAGLDVFCHEPDINPALLKLSNVTLQPHQGSATEETRLKMGMNVVDNLLAHFTGKPLLTPLF
ncbi:2-hydroxyacid dehydrogenase [Acetobacteraceae bacterium ESL0709]|nr:2-hydroxyacid dehydrogenase [Acetobacteraceae bacterium ESL0697]MDF7678717.1 2-hydroxyacid dehydrogenase [Acetobacteraceae bacterium ESL0709]